MYHVLCHVAPRAVPLSRSPLILLRDKGEIASHSFRFVWLTVPSSLIKSSRKRLMRDLEGRAAVFLWPFTGCACGKVTVQLWPSLTTKAIWVWEDLVGIHVSLTTSGQEGVRKEQTVLSCSPSRPTSPETMQEAPETLGRWVMMCVCSEAWAAQEAKHSWGPQLPLKSTPWTPGSYEP